MKKPIVIEMFTDNGEHSHWKLIDISTGETLWKQGQEQLLQQPPICQHLNIDSKDGLDECLDCGVRNY